MMTQPILRVKERMLPPVKVWKSKKERESESSSKGDLGPGGVLKKRFQLNEIWGNGCECLISSDICINHDGWVGEMKKDSVRPWYLIEASISNFTQIVQIQPLKQFLKQQNLRQCLNGSICSYPLFCFLFFFSPFQMISDQTKLHIGLSDISKIALVIKSIKIYE